MIMYFQHHTVQTVSVMNFVGYKKGKSKNFKIKNKKKRTKASFKATTPSTTI